MSDLPVQVDEVGSTAGDTMDDLDYPGLVFSDILYPVDVNSFKNNSPLLELETQWTKKKLFFNDDTRLFNAPGRGHGKHLFTNRLLLAALQDERYNRLGKGQRGQRQIPFLGNYDEYQFEPYSDSETDEIGIEFVEIENSDGMDTEMTPHEIIAASKLLEPAEMEPEPEPGCSYEGCESVKHEAITEEMATNTFQMDNETGEQQYVDENGDEFNKGDDEEEEGITSSTWCEAAELCFKDVGDWCSSSSSAKATNSNSMTYGDDSDSDQIDERKKASPKKYNATSTSLKMKTTKIGQLLTKKISSSKMTGVITAQDELRILVDQDKETGGQKRGQKTSNN